ncbi:MAG TPA: oligosaccharide flippase family protein [Saliniramus sp.]|nr:oligosaccharide flippase family protein [Saliniramus sp.]
MSATAGGGGAKRVRLWVGIAAAEAAGRLALQVGVTALLARMLAPEEFGSAALVLTIIAVLAVCVETPFEEALAQRRVLRRPDLEAALAASFAAAFFGVAIAAGAGQAAAAIFDRADLGVILPVAALVLLAHAPLSIALAVARRRRAFGHINLANLLGHCVGAAAAIAAAFAGWGIWALIWFRVVVVVVCAISLSVSMRLVVVPRWDRRRIAGFASFARMILAARLVESLTYLVFNFLVGHAFGLGVLGYVNMAMRIVEPVRGAVAAIGHNLSFSFFMAARGDRERLIAAIREGSRQSGLLSAPIFMGIAAVSPVLIPVLAGPGWELAAPIAALLAMGGMVLMPSQIVAAALSADGKPEYVLYASLVGFATLVAALALVAFAGLGPVSVGATRLMADVAQAIAIISLGCAATGLSRRALLHDVAVPWAAALGMACVVTGMRLALPDNIPPIVVLAILVATGVLAYGSVLFVVARSRLFGLIGAVTGRRLLIDESAR